MKKIFCLASLYSFSLFAQSLPPKALVYGGYGVCEDDCLTGAVEAARVAGFQTEVILPESYDCSQLENASVWIQPGGKASQQAKSMGQSMMNDVKNFVKKGGGYVGFCAGAFIATNKIGSSWFKSGYGFIPGKTVLYKAAGYPTIENMSFGETQRQIYWEGGPHFVLSKENLKTAEVRSKYLRTNQISSVRAPYGEGRAYVTGAHPEAPEWWRTDARLIDSDGLDYDVTTEMILWAARRN